MHAVKSDIEIARKAKMRPIKDILAKIKVPDSNKACLLYTSPSPRDKRQSRMPSSA